MLKISLETLLNGAVPYKINYFFSCLYILLRFFCALYCFFADDCARYLVHSQILLAYRTIVLVIYLKPIFSFLRVLSSLDLNYMAMISIRAHKP